MDKGLPQEFFQEIIDKNDIVTLVSEYVTLKRSGRSFLGLCPFHSEKSPSFNVNPTKRFFYCFGCGAGGNAINFLMKIENLDFLGAARRLADRAGIPWPETQAITAKDPHREELYRINSLAVAFFNQYLFKSDAGKKALAYLERRRIDEACRTRFQLGYAPPAWHHLTELLRKKGIAMQQAEELGLVAIGENGYYDRFRDRLIFPVADAKGNIVGFGGRVFDDSQPKYLNSPETVIFHKGNLWYGLNLAKDAIRKKNQAIIVEGYLDVIQAHQAGFSQTIASLGTSLTREQAKILKRYTSEVVLAYDGDTAGQHATQRGLEILHEAGLKVRILTLPAGADPDSFIKENGAAAFSELVNQAAGLIDYKIQSFLEQFDLQSPEGQSGAVRQILPVLGMLTDNITREAYIRRVAREIGITETAVFSEFENWKRHITRAQANPYGNKSLGLDRNDNKSYTKEMTEKKADSIGVPDLAGLAPQQQILFKVEKELLQLALQEYDKLARIKEELKTEEFIFPIWRDLYAALNQNYDAVQSFSGFTEVRDSIRETAAALTAEAQLADKPADLEGLLARWRMLNLQEQVQRLANQITSGRDEAGQPCGDEDLKIKIAKFTELKRKLQKDYPHFSAGI